MGNSFTTKQWSATIAHCRPEWLIQIGTGHDSNKCLAGNWSSLGPLQIIKAANNCQGPTMCTPCLQSTPFSHLSVWIVLSLSLCFFRVLSFPLNSKLRICWPFLLLDPNTHYL
jgi:hypothetical protein